MQINSNVNGSVGPKFTKAFDSFGITTNEKIIDLVNNKKKSLHEVAIFFNMTIEDIKMICFNEVIRTYSSGFRNKALSLKDYATNFQIISEYDKLNQVIREECMKRYNLDPLIDDQALSITECSRIFDVSKSSLKVMIKRDQGMKYKYILFIIKKYHNLILLLLFSKLTIN